MATAVSKRLFTADEYHQMVKGGILAEDDRVELIDGEVLAMTPIGPRHGTSADRATRALILAAGDRAIVRTQGSVCLGAYTEPQPDVVLLRARADGYATRHPGPGDILLVIEVADSSLEYDRDVKAPLYAKTGIPEYWLVNLRDNVLIRHRQPEQGVYRSVDTFSSRQTLAPALLPNCSLSIDVLLPA